MGERLAKGEKLAVVGVEDGAGPGAQECEQPPEAEKSRKWILPRASRKEHSLPTP